MSPATSVVIYGELSHDEQRIILLANGPDHEVAHAARYLETLTPLIKATKPPGALELPATWAAVCQLSATFGQAWRTGPALTGWLTRQVVSRMTESGGLSVALPPGWAPRSYQVDAARMISHVGRVLLFDDPGTGKTASAILGLLEREAAGVAVRPVIAVAPASVVDSWCREFALLAPGWRTIAWRGSASRREKLPGLADVYVTSYDMTRQDAQDTNPRNSPLIRIGARSVIADEFHKIKNHNAQQSRAVRRLGERASTFVGLSGTPITHHPADLWPALVALAPGAWPSRERWVNRYCVQGMADYGEKILGLNSANEAEFRTVLLGQNRRVAKADVLAELPPKVYSVREVELPAAHRRAYDEFESSMLAQLPDDGGELSVMDTLAKINFLSLLACAAADVTYETETVWDDALGMEVEKVHTHVHPKLPSWKVDALLEILEEREGLHTIVAAPSKRLIMLAGAAAEKAGYRVGYIVGGQKPAERTGAIDSFQAGELDLICLTTQAGGVGITLTAASAIVFLMRPYSLVDAVQTEDRAHRIGSERHESIDVIDIVAKNTIDTRIRAVLGEKAGQLSDLVKDPRIAAELLGGASVTKIKSRRTA